MDKRAPNQNASRSKREFRTLKERFNPPIWHFFEIRGIFLASRYSDIYFLVSRYNNFWRFLGIRGIFYCHGITIFDAFRSFAAFSSVLPPHETTVKANFGKISAGIKTIPAENVTGHLFGHDFFRAIPRLEMAIKSIKMMRRRRRRRSKHGHRSAPKKLSPRSFTVFSSVTV